MRLASYAVRGRTSFGAVLGSGIIDLRLRFGTRFASIADLLRAHALDETRAAINGVRVDFGLGDVVLLPPILAPEKIFCVGANYAARDPDHKDGSDEPRYPSLFLRTPGSLVGHGQAIVRPKESEQLDYEGEIALVIGREGRRVPRARALDLIAGYTLCNEGCVRGWMRHGRFNLTHGKNFDASGSIGPWIVTSDEIEPARPLHLTTRVNGEVRQDDTTESMLLSFAEIVAYISSFTTLKPGDVIATGAPAGVGVSFDPPRFLVPGDVVEIAVPEIGTLRNMVVDET